MIPVEDFMKALCDKDKNNISCTAIFADCNVTDLTTNETKQITSTTMQKPVISVQRHNEFVQIDFKFISSLDNDLKMLWNTLELYGKEIDSLNVEESTVPRLASGTITLVPTQFDGKYFAVIGDPIFWSLTCPDIGESANVIRVLVDAEHFQIFENKGIDMEALEKEIDSEIAYQARQEAEMQKNKI